MTDIAHVRDGLVNYLNSEVIPHLPVKQQFLAGMVIGIARSRADQVIEEVAKNPAVKMLGIIDGQQIDIDVLYQSAKEQIQRTKNLELDIPLIGKLKFSESDIDSLYQFIQKG